MKRSWYKSLVLLVALGGLAAPAWGQDAAAAKRDKLQKLKAEREAARKGGAVTPPPQPTPTPTPPPPPPPTQTTPPPPPPPPPPTQTTPPPPPPPPTRTATATATGSATASPKGSASATPPSASASASAKPPSSSDATPALPGLEELRKTRKDRRRAQVSKLKERWGDLTKDERARAELKLHAQRSAYLQRIRALAEKANDAKLVESVDKLITKEDLRDASKMNSLRSGAPAPAASGAK